jgi:ABC-type sulfate/molybdate transport systems ATPase subunit
MSDWNIRAVTVERAGFSMGPVSFDLHEGEALVVVGPNGAGKTTLLRAIAGLERLSGGSVGHDGLELTERPPEGRGIGYIPPGLGLFPHQTVLRNVAFPWEVRGDPEARSNSRRLLVRFGLERFVARYPRSLSSGEQQRVAVARALAAAPGLLLWDEPVAALDVATRHELHENLRLLREEDRIPLVFVTHDPADAFGIADQFVRLESGRVLRSGRLDRFGEHPRSAFDARFLGFSNVLSSNALQAASTPSGRWLRERAGPGGIAFSARAVRVDPGGPFEAAVRRIEPRAEATRMQLTLDGLVILAEAPGDGPGTPALGAAVRFDVEEAALWPLDAWEEPSGS